jgi:hypothetical protein
MPSNEVNYNGIHVRCTIVHTVGDWKAVLASHFLSVHEISAKNKARQEEEK